MDEDEEIVDREDTEEESEGQSAEPEPEEEEAPEEQFEPEPAAEDDEPPTVSEWTPPMSDTPEFQRLSEKLADPDIAADLRAVMRAEFAQQNAVNLVTQTHLANFAADNPEAHKRYGAKAAQVLAQMPAEQRTKRGAINSAMLIAAVGDHTEDPAAYQKAVQAYAASLGKGRSAPRPRTAIPPEQRPPSPSGSRAAPANSRTRVEKEIATRFGFTPRGIDELMEDLV